MPLYEKDLVTTHIESTAMHDPGVPAWRVTKQVVNEREEYVVHGVSRKYFMKEGVDPISQDYSVELRFTNWEEANKVTQADIGGEFSAGWAVTQHMQNLRDAGVPMGNRIRSANVILNGASTTANAASRLVKIENQVLKHSDEVLGAIKGVNNFTVKDLNSFRGAKSGDVMQWLEENGWSGIKTNPNRVYNDGMRFTNGTKGEQIRIMPGGPTRSIPEKTGPYMEVSINGKKTVIELFGNPTLNK